MRKSRWTPSIVPGATIRMSISCAFDILALDGEDLRKLALHLRRADSVDDVARKCEELGLKAKGK
jgi:hypothetical protein